MLTFLKLWEIMSSQESLPLNASGESSPAMRSIRRGLEMRGDSNRTFWDDFVQLCNDTDGVAELLGVQPDQVAGWGARVNELVEKVDREYSDQGISRNQVVSTGNPQSPENGG